MPDKPLAPALYLAASNAKEFLQSLLDSHPDRIHDVLVARGREVVDGLSAALNGAPLLTRETELEDISRALLLALSHLVQGESVDDARTTIAKAESLLSGKPHPLLGKRDALLLKAATLLQQEAELLKEGHVIHPSGEWPGDEDTAQARESFNEMTETAAGLRALIVGPGEEKHAGITDGDRETARLAVSLVLREAEAAWEPVSQLIAEHVAALRAKLAETERLRFGADATRRQLRVELAALREKLGQ